MGDYIEEHYDFPLTKVSENKPLKGVRVIDAGNMVAAPFATRAERFPLGVSWEPPSPSACRAPPVR